MPTGSTEVVSVAVVTALAPVPVVVSVPVPRVTPPLVNVTVPVAGDVAPVIVGTVNVKTTGEPNAEVVGLIANVSLVPAALFTTCATVFEVVPAT